MKKLMMWQVGDVGNIRVWKDGLKDFEPQPVEPSKTDEHFRVCILIERDKCM